MLKWLSKLPPNKRRAREIQEKSRHVEIAIRRYKNMEAEVRKEIEENHIAKLLIYEKGGSCGES
ncbi:hypothetical protein D3C75_136090 [compost metagenome]